MALGGGTTATGSRGAGTCDAALTYGRPSAGNEGRSALCKVRAFFLPENEDQPGLSRRKVQETPKAALVNETPGRGQGKNLKFQGLLPWEL